VLRTTLNFTNPTSRPKRTSTLPTGVAFTWLHAASARPMLE
jgi:hypothetical protein